MEPGNEVSPRPEMSRDRKITLALNALQATAVINPPEGRDIQICLCQTVSDIYNGKIRRDSGFTLEGLPVSVALDNLAGDQIQLLALGNDQAGNYPFRHFNYRENGGTRTVSITSAVDGMDTTQYYISRGGDDNLWQPAENREYWETCT
ncbi:MAG: hypothetical protein WC686_04560 [Candidatus Shapirobacteria bacterium]|jgi:hypothetical protein